MISFIVPIEPAGQMRAGRTVVRGRVHTYKDRKQERAENDFLRFAVGHRPAEPLVGPLLLGVQAFFPVPKSWSRKKQVAAIRDAWRPKTPDLDNILKHVKDCLTTAGFWLDDNQVVGFLPETGKFYDDAPRYEVAIVPAPPGRPMLLTGSFPPNRYKIRASP